MYPLNNMNYRRLYHRVLLLIEGVFGISPAAARFDHNPRVSLHTYMKGVSSSNFFYYVIICSQT
jgi:hypothetical protein